MILCGLELEGPDPPPGAVIIAAVVVIEIIDPDTDKRHLHQMCSDMTSWAQVGMLMAAVDTARRELAEEWEGDE